MGKQVKHDNEELVMAEKLEMPEIMCRWQLSEKRPHEFNTMAQNKIEELYDDGFFDGKNEKNIIKKMIETMFNPDKLASCMVAISDSVSLLKECAKNGNRLLILSNMDADTFERMYNSEKLKSVFQNFNADDIVVSGYVKMLKPHKNITNMS